MQYTLNTQPLADGWCAILYDANTDKRIGNVYGQQTEGQSVALLVSLYIPAS